MQFVNLITKIVSQSYFFLKQMLKEIKVIQSFHLLYNIF